VDSEVATSIVRVIHNDNELWRSLGKDMTLRLRDLIPFVLNLLRVGRPLGEWQQSEKRVLIFTGGTGVGKTTTIAKIATRLKMAGISQPSLISTDVFRMGGVDHLRTYAELIGTPFQVVEQPENLASAIGTVLGQSDFVFVDTPGYSNTDHERISFVKKCISALPQSYTFNVSAVNQSSRLRGATVAVPFDGHIFTKLDETELRGEIVAQAFQSKRPVHYLCHGQRVPDDLEIATRDTIGNAVFQRNWGE
jgi:flagellar biosynthesis protein FlhF